MKAISHLALVALFSTNLLASEVTFTGNPQEKTIEGQDLKIYDTADVFQVATKRSGDGMRSSFLGNSYYLVSYLDSAVTLEEGKVIEGVRAAKAKALQLTMYMDMDGPTIRNAFLKALNKNKPYNEEGMKALLDQFTFDIDAGEVILITGRSTDNGEEEVVIELPEGKIIKGQGKDLATDLWKVWLGNPVDAQMGKLQKQLIGKVQ